jgi:hypothetical protein
MSLKPMRDVAGGTVKYWPLLAKAGLLAAFSGGGFALWLMQVPVPAWPFAFVPVALWLFWHAGWAWGAMRSIEIRIGDLEYDPEWLAYFVTITSLTDEHTTSEVFLKSITDAHGKAQGVMLKRLECRWRDCEPNEHPKLSFKGASAQSTILKPGRDQNGNVFLQAFQPDHTMKPVTRAVPLEQREVLHVTISATCADKSGERGNSTAGTFELTPKSDSEEYTIRPIGA